MTTQTLTITDFLLARIADDEAVARAAVRDDNGVWHCEPDWTGSSEKSTLTSQSTRTLFACCERGRNLNEESREAESALRELGLEPWPEPGIEHLHEDGRGIGVADLEEVTHIARHDPARVLAECAAKRAIVERAACDCCAVSTEAEWTLRVLAYPFADHPDYDESWRP